MIRSLPALFLLVICASCGNVLPAKMIARMPASVVVTQPPYDQRLYLGVLEEKYKAENKTMGLSIVRGMILGLEEKWPELENFEVKTPTKEMTSRPAFRSLEMTVEHLSHRESVRIQTRHNAFHKAP